MKTKRWRRGISILLSCALMGSLMPAVVFAGETEPVLAKAILPGTAGIDSPAEVHVDKGTYYEPNDYIYYGSFEGFPIKWRVLDAQKANDRATDGMFLLSEQMVEHGVNYGYFGGNGEWQDSEAQYWCKNFAQDPSNFSAAEQAAMLGVEKTEEDQTQFYIDWYGSQLTAEDKMFFLSAKELADYVGDFDNAPGHQTTLLEDNSPGRYWLRSVFSKAAEQGNAAEAVPYKDGVYKGHDKTEMVVKVTIQNGKIVSIEQTNTHTPDRFRRAWDAVYPQILEKQSVEVDGVSGATLSSDSIKKAVGRALESAKKDAQTEPSITKDETGVVVETVGLYHFWVALGYNARTACNLNMDSVLFTSPAEDIKTAELGAFSEIGTYDGKEWKMTLRDDDRSSFQAAAASEREKEAAPGYTDWKVKVNYSGAKEGENEYVSAMLCDKNGEYLYYGSLANNSAEGTAEITIPENLPLGKYTLNVFSEQKNGSRSSDYASEFAAINLEVKEKIESDSTQEPTTTAPTQKPASTVVPAAPEVGAVIEDETTNSICEVTGSSSVEYSKPKEAKASVAIPASVTVGGKTYEVTSIAANAFKNNKKLKKVVIPAKINKIGKNAFRKCKNLKRVVIKTKKLKAKSIGANAFKNISPKAVIKVPKGKAKAYRKILRAKGLSKNAKVK